MYKIAIITLILFCIVGFLCGRWAGEVNREMRAPTTLERDGTICLPPEEYKEKGGSIMEWFMELAWYFKVAFVAILACLGYYFLA